MVALKYQNEDEWHAIRRRHVGASEVAALFGEHPYISMYELYHRKRGDLPDIEETQRMFWGNMLEPAVAKGVAEQTGWNVKKVRRYLSHDDVTGMGASLDYEVVANDRGPGVLQIKTHDRFAVAKWEDGEPPMYEELQIQQEIELRKVDWGAIGVLVGGNELRIFERDRHQGSIDAIKAAIPKFWERVANDDEPAPNGAIDREVILALYGTVEKDSVIDMREHEHFNLLCQMLEFSRSQMNAYKAAADAASAEIIHQMQSYHKAQLADGRICYAPLEKRKGYTVEPTEFRKISIRRPKST